MLPGRPRTDTRPRSWRWMPCADFEGHAEATVVAVMAALIAVILFTPHAEAQVGGPIRSSALPGRHALPRGQSYETHHYFKELRDFVLQAVFRTTEQGAPLIEVEWAIRRGLQTIAQLAERVLAPSAPPSTRDGSRSRTRAGAGAGDAHSRSAPLRPDDQPGRPRRRAPGRPEGVAMYHAITREMMCWVAAMASR